MTTYMTPLFILVPVNGSEKLLDELQTIDPDQMHLI